MILIFAIPAAFLAAFLICGAICELAALGMWVDRILSGQPDLDIEQEIDQPLADVIYWDFSSEDISA